MKRKRIRVRQRKGGTFRIGIAAGVYFFVGWLVWQIVNISGLWLIALFVGFPILVIFVWLGNWRSNQQHVAAQPLRNSEANLAGGVSALYLRPFFTAGLCFDNPFRSYWKLALIGFSIDPPLLLCEQFVARVLEPYINVREIGGNPLLAGIGRLTTEEEWKDTFGTALNEAQVVIIIPAFYEDPKTGQTSGEMTLWEIQQLMVSKRMDRAIAIMPKKFPRIPTREYWQESQKRLADLGLILPNYDWKGCVLVFDQVNNHWEFTKKFGQRGFGKKRLAKGLLEALMFQSERHGFSLLGR